MTKKDYVLIADALKAVGNAVSKDSTPESMLSAMVSRLSSALASDNPKFNFSTFAKACESKLYKAD